MSYALAFLQAEDAPIITADEYFRFFESRPYYQVNREVGQAFYLNENTGVHFDFQIHPDEPPEQDDEAEAATQLPAIAQEHPAGAGSAAPDAPGSSRDPGDVLVVSVDDQILAGGEFEEEFEEDDEPEDGLEFAGLTFEINYCRPHFYALEAAPELDALVKRFELSVDDPQADGMGRGPFDSDQFIQSWNSDNRYGVWAVYGASVGGRLPPAMPAAVLHEVWLWNRQIPELSEALDQRAFVPQIVITMATGEPKTCVVWVDAQPILLPKVDYVLLCRRDLARRKSLIFRRKTKDMEKLLVPWERILPVLPPSLWVEGDGAPGYYALGGVDHRPTALRFFRSLPSAYDELKPLGFSRILDLEVRTEVLGTLE